MARPLVVLVAFAAFQAGARDVPDPARTAAPELVVPATVTRVVDGDGLHVRLDSGPMKVRLHGIDAPELGAPHGREAKQALERLAGAREVELVPAGQDRFDRMLAIVLVEGSSVNEALLSGGHAWAFRRYLGTMAGDERYCELEARAREARRGLWSQPPARWVPPWIWRARQRAAPGAQVPSQDYAHETAADCAAASGRAGAAIQQAGEPGLSGRDSCRIKGNIGRRGARIYHVPGTAGYAQTRIDERRGERWFCSEAEARAAGWRAPR